MVKKITGLFLTAMLLLAVSAVSFAEDDLRIEQFAARLPNVDVYFYAQNEPLPSEVHLNIGQKQIQAQEITKISSSDVTHHYFLVDVSTSTTYAQINAVVQSINEFANTKNESDTVTLITFGVQVSTLLQRETNSENIINATSQIQANEAGTLFFDALATVSNLASAEDIANERKLLYVFSDSVDYNLGGYTAQETQNLLLNANLPLYAFGYDNGSKENLDNFGALARQTGGLIYIVNAENLNAQFTQNTNYLNEQVYIAKFNTGSNILPAQTEDIKLNVQGQIVAFTPTFNYFIADNTPPQITNAVQKTQNTLEITFSEHVLGANVSENFILIGADGAPIGAQSAVYSEENFTALLTINVPYTGELEIKAENITDISREENEVTGQISITFEGVQNENTQVDININGEGTAPIGAYIFLVVLVIAIAAVIIVVAIKKRNAPSALQVTQDAPTVPLMDQQLINSGQTGKAHFVHNNNNKIILEVVNSAGAGKRVTLPISSTMFVGRSDICDVVFDDIKMSRQHFVIEEKQGEFTITNLSGGGTLLNGVPINSTRQLNHGDKIEAGNHTIVFIIPK